MTVGIIIANEFDIRIGFSVTQNQFIFSGCRSRAKIYIGPIATVNTDIERALGIAGIINAQRTVAGGIGYRILESKEGSAKRNVTGKGKNSSGFFGIEFQGHVIKEHFPVKGNVKDIGR